MEDDLFLTDEGEFSNESTEDFDSEKFNLNADVSDQEAEDSSETSISSDEDEETDSYENDALELIYEKLESIEEVVCASPAPDVPFLNADVSSLSVSEGLLLLIFLVLLSFLIKDWIGGILESCIKR